MDEEAAPLLETQKTCYDLRAPDYMDLAEPSDRPGRGFLRDDEAAALVNELHPEGDVHLVIGRANQDTVQRSARVFEDTGARRTLTVCRRRAGAPVRSSGGDHNVTGGCRAVRE